MSTAGCAPAWIAEESRFLFQSGGLTVTIEAADPHAKALPTYRPDLGAALPAISPFVLWEWARYKILVSPPLDDLTIRYGDQRAEALGHGVYLIQYQNSLGGSQIRFADTLIADLPVEVISRKLGTPDRLASYPTLYRQMVADVTAQMLTLPFHMAGATAHAVARTNSPAGPFFALQFLRRCGKAVVSALNVVGREPFRILHVDEELRPAGQARRLGTGALRWGLTHPADWIEPANRSLAWIGGQYLPGRLPQVRGMETFDTPENRFVKHFLQILMRAADEAIRYMDALRLNDPEITQGLRTVRDGLRVTAGWPWLQDVGVMTYLPAASQVLQRKDGYRELMQLYPEFLLASSPFGSSLDKAIAARNVADLYEYWCFLRLVNELGAVLGPPTLNLDTDEAGGLKHGLQVTFEGAAHRLVYNQGFRGGRASYSLGLQPDYTLLGPNDQPQVAFDAKFRLDAPMPDLDDPRHVSLSPQATDLYKMHTYRDALGLRAAVALYPGDQTVFYDQRTRRARRDVSLEDVIRNADLHGVSAIPFRPGGEELWPTS